MFTGIIQECGRIQQVITDAAGKQFWVATNFSDLTLGESIAVNGICLTVAEIKANSFRCKFIVSENNKGTITFESINEIMV